MEILTLILATTLAIVLYWWMLRWNQGLLHIATLPSSDTSIVLSPATKDIVDQQHSAFPDKQETTTWQPEVKLTTLSVSLRFLEGEDRQGGTSTTVLSPYDTVAEAKKKLAIEGRRLVFAGKPLDDAKTIEECGVKDGAALYSTSPETVAFQVQSFTGTKYALRCNAQDRVTTLRLKVETVLGIAGRHVALVLREQELNNSMTLKDSGLQDGDIVHLEKRFRDVSGRIIAQSLPEPSESWGDAVVDQAMRALYLTNNRNHITRGEDSNIEGPVHIKRNVIEGFRFEMSRSMVVIVVLVFEDPYLLEVECSWTADQAKDMLQRALGIPISQELRFYFCEKEINDFYGLGDGDFVELCSKRD